MYQYGDMNKCNTRINEHEDNVSVCHFLHLKLNRYCALLKHVFWLVAKYKSNKRVFQ